MIISPQFIYGDYLFTFYFLLLKRIYLATIIWHGVEREVAVLAMDRRPLIGTALIEDYHLSVDFYEGGSVVIDEIL